MIAASTSVAFLRFQPSSSSNVETALSVSAIELVTAANVTIIGMQFLDFFDFLTNSVMMPIAAIMICLLVSRAAGIKAVEAEVLHGEGTFRRKKIFCVMIKYICPIFAAIILISSVANAFGWISM